MSKTTMNPKDLRVRQVHQQMFTLMWLGMKQFVGYLQRYGLTQPQFVTLAALVHHRQPATMQQLAKVTLQDAPTMTGIVNRLVKMGLVQRTRSDADRRVVLVEATTAGADLIERVDCELGDMRPISFYGLPDEDLDRLENILDEILLIILKKASSAQQTTLAQAKTWLQSFAADPIEFVKNQENANPSLFSTYSE